MKSTKKKEKEETIFDGMFRMRKKIAFWRDQKLQARLKTISFFCADFENPVHPVKNFFALFAFFVPSCLRGLNFSSFLRQPDDPTHGPFYAQ